MHVSMMCEVIFAAIHVGLPIPIVIVSAAASHENYGIINDNGDTIV